MSQNSVTGTSIFGSADDCSRTGPGREVSSSAQFQLPQQIPVPRPAVRHDMALLAHSLGQSFEVFGSDSRDEPLGYLVPVYGLLLLGTACRRPLLCEEAQEIGDEQQLNVAIIRSDDRDFLGSMVTTLDLLLLGSQNWLSRLKPWRRTPADDLWFAPIQGEGRAVRLCAGLLALSPRAPFSNLFEREYGFEVAHAVAHDRSQSHVGGRSGD